MTVAAKPSVAIYNEDGVTTSFPARFRYQQPSDLVVERLAPDGTITGLAFGTGFTATDGATDDGGQVTPTIISTGTRLRIRRQTPREQQTKYPTSGRFPAQAAEGDFDVAMLIAQELDDENADIMSRALRVPDGETVSELPSRAARSGAMAAWDGNGNLTAVGGLAPLVGYSIVNVRLALASLDLTQAVVDALSSDPADEARIRWESAFRMTIGDALATFIQAQIGAVAMAQMLALAQTLDAETGAYEASLNSAPAESLQLRALLGARDGANLLGYDPTLIFAAGTIGAELARIHAKAPYIAAQNGGALDYLATNAALTNYARGGAVAISGVARTSDTFGTAGEAAICLGFAAFSDKIYAGNLGPNGNGPGAGPSLTGIWGLYGAFIREANVGGSTLAIEVDGANRGENVYIDPHHVTLPGVSALFWGGSGGELSNTEALGNLSAWGVMLNNSYDGQPKFLSGLVIADGALDPTRAEAIGMPLGAGIRWWASGVTLSALSGMAHYQGVKSDGADCFIDQSVRTKGDGSRWAAGTQLYRHDVYDHFGGTQADTQVVLSALTLGGGAGGYQALARNNSGTLIGIGVNTQGDNSVAPVGGDAAISLGRPTSRWGSSYFSVNPTVGSDASLKKVEGPVSDDFLDAIGETVIVHAKFLQSIAEKGEDQARIHAVIIAQDLRDRLTAKGIDWHRYGVIGEDPVTEDYDDVEDVTEDVFLEDDVPVYEFIPRDGGGVTRVQSGTRKQKRAQPETTLEPIYNADGSPVITPAKPARRVRQADGSAITIPASPERQARMEVVVTQTVSKTVIKTRPVWADEAQTVQKTLLNIRYEQFALYRSLWSDREIARLNAIVADLRKAA